jgi:hypothetical protein
MQPQVAKAPGMGLTIQAEFLIYFKEKKFRLKKYGG